MDKKLFSEQSGDCFQHFKKSTKTIKSFLGKC